MTAVFWTIMVVEGAAGAFVVASLIAELRQVWREHRR